MKTSYVNLLIKKSTNQKKNPPSSPLALDEEDAQNCIFPSALYCCGDWIPTPPPLRATSAFELLRQPLGPFIVSLLSSSDSVPPPTCCMFLFFFFFSLFFSFFLFFLFLFFPPSLFFTNNRKKSQKNVNGKADGVLKPFFFLSLLLPLYFHTCPLLSLLLLSTMLIGFNSSTHQLNPPPP